MTINSESMRRSHYPFLGPNREFPDIGPGSLRSWYCMLPENRRVQAREEVAILKTIFGVSRLSEISSHFKDSDKKKETYSRFKKFLQHRHNIEITDKPNSTSPTLNFPEDQKLPHAYAREATRFTGKEFDDFIANSLKTAMKVFPYVGDKHTGVLRPVFDRISTTNEIPGGFQVYDLLYGLFSEKYSHKSRYEMRFALTEMTAALEFHLYQKKIEPVKSEFFLFLDQKTFNPDSHGPTQNITVLSKHDPYTNFVNGVQDLEDNDLYTPQPFWYAHTLSVRKIHPIENSPNLTPYAVQVEDSYKDSSSYLIKMLRNNVIDPEKIRDGYRLSMTFLERQDIERFLEHLDKLSKQDQSLLEFSIEEKALDGKKYEATDGDISHLQAGKSEHYQVMRVKILFKGSRFELSLYTPEAYLNYLYSEEVSVQEYLVRRLIEPSRDEDTRTPLEGGVIDYMYTEPGVASSIRNSMPAMLASAQADNRHIPMGKIDEHQNKMPRVLTSHERMEAVRCIVSSVAAKKIMPTHIIAIGNNSLPYAADIATAFGSQIILFDKSELSLEEISKSIPHENSVLIVDDIGQQGKNVAKVKELFPHAVSAFLAIRKNSVVANDPGNIAGIQFEEDQQVLFPDQLSKTDLIPRRIVSGLILRKNPENSKWEILIQKEVSIKNPQKGEVWKLPGGWRNGDLSDPLALRRELGEEYGEKGQDIVSSHMRTQFPVEAEVKYNTDGPDVPANKIHLSGYIIDGSDITRETLEHFQPIETIQIKEFRWVSLDDASGFLNMPGYQALMQNLQERLNQSREEKIIYHR